MEQALTAIGFLFLGILVGAFGMARFAFIFYMNKVRTLGREKRISYENYAYDWTIPDASEFPSLAQIAEKSKDGKEALALLMSKATKPELAMAYLIVLDACTRPVTIHTPN